MAEVSLSSIASKQDVEYLDLYDSAEVAVGTQYSYWVSGSVHEDDTFYMGWVEGGSQAEHSLEQIRASLAPVDGERILTPLPIPWRFCQTDVTVNGSQDTEPDPAVYYLKRSYINAPGLAPGRYGIEAPGRPNEVAI